MTTTYANFVPGLTEVDQAMAILRANGWILKQSLLGGINATHPATMRRRDRQTAANLIELAAQYTQEAQDER